VARPRVAEGRPELTRFLTVSGILLPDNRLLLEPGFVTDDPADPTGDGEESILAEVVGEAESTLLRHRLATARFVGDAEPLAEQAVLGKIPLPVGARSIRFLRDGILIHELVLPQAEPEVTLDWEPGDRPIGRQTVKWSASDRDGLPLRFIAGYSNDAGETWRPLGLPTTETSLEVDFDALPGGNGRLAVLATNGGRTTRAVSTAFRLPIRPCQALILSPESGSTVASGQDVQLHGQGYYLEEARPEVEQLAWESSIDGELGSGPFLAVPLSDGTHEITLHAGAGRRRGSTTKELIVEPSS
jgi:hypothetical protein